MTTVLYVGTDEGVKTVRRADDGSWELASGKMPAWAIEALIVHPADPSIVIAGTRGDGVWVSEDAGATFKKPCYGRPGPGKVRALAVDPVEHNRLYAGCEPIDLYVSEDLGKSWQVVESLRAVPWVETVEYPGAAVEPHLRDIAIDPSNPDVIYCALQVGYILKTTDRGKTWKLLDKGLDKDVHDFAIDPTDPNRIVIATGGHDARLGTTGGKSLFATNDGGESWFPLAKEFEQDYSKQLILKPGQPEVAFTSLASGNPGKWRSRESGAEGILIRTKDGGQTWEEIELSNLPGASKTMVSAFAPDVDNPEVIYAAFDNGEFIASSDGGDTWSSMGVKVDGLNEMVAASI